MNVTISRTNDPFKKYWWVILLLFVVVGGFMCMSGGDGSSGGYSGSAASKGGEQSLDSQNNPNGAQGSAVDLAMDGTHKRKDGPIMSSLYQAPEEEKTSTAAVGAVTIAAGPSLADKLKDVTHRSAASASADSSGWGSEKAQKGFTAPKIGGAGFSNIASGGGGGGGGGDVGGGSLGAFGSAKANTGVSFAKGLHGSAAADEGAKDAKPLMRALNNAASASLAAANTRSADAASGLSGQSFDGSRGGGGFSGGAAGRGPGSGYGDGGAGGAGAGAYNRLDMAPANLKGDDKGHIQKNIQPPAATAPPPEKQNLMQQMMQMMIMSLPMMLMSALMSSLI